MSLNWLPGTIAIKLNTKYYCCSAAVPSWSTIVQVSANTPQCIVIYSVLHIHAQSTVGYGPQHAPTHSGGYMLELGLPFHAGQTGWKGGNGE